MSVRYGRHEISEPTNLSKVVPWPDSVTQGRMLNQAGQDARARTSRTGFKQDLSMV